MSNYSTPTLPNIKKNLNRSQDYATTGFPGSNGQVSGRSKRSIKSKNSKMLNFENFMSEEGTEMFNAQMEFKTSELQKQMVNNRLKRLEFEEQRARDKIYKAQLKAMRLQQLKAEKDREREHKQRMKELMEKDIELKKREHTLDRVKTKEHIKTLQHSKIDDNIQAREELKQTLKKAHKDRQRADKEEAQYRQKLKEKVVGDKEFKKSIRVRLQTNM